MSLAPPDDASLRPNLGVLIWRLGIPLVASLALVGIAVFVVWPPEWANGSPESQREQWLCVLVTALSGPTVLAAHYLMVRHRSWRFTPDGLEIHRRDRVVATIARDQIAEIRVHAAGLILITAEQQTRFLTYVARSTAKPALERAVWPNTLMV